MELTQQGDGEACRALLDDLGPAIMNFLRKRVADPQELEDVYQETFLALYQARRTYDPSRPLEPWLFAIARNVAADHSRRHWARTRWQELTDAPDDYLAGGSADIEPNLEQVLSRLPGAQREAFEMLKLKGLSIEEAAGRAGVSAGALKVRAHRAYRALRKLIAR